MPSREGITTSTYLLTYLLTYLVAFSEILRLLYVKSHFSVHNPYFGQNFGVFPWIRSAMLGSEESEHTRLTKCEIIYVEFQPM